MTMPSKKPTNLDKIRAAIRTIPDFPIPGIQFRDVTTLFKNPEAYRLTIEAAIEKSRDYQFDAIAGIESRGFVLAGAMAFQLNKGCILMRKPGKLPGETISESYTLEYGTNTLEVHKDAIQPGQKVFIIDDLLATGGTARAVAKLVERLGGEVAAFGFVVDLPALKGTEAIKNYPVFSLVAFEGE